MEFIYSKFDLTRTRQTVMVGSDSTGGGPEDFDQLVCPMTLKIVTEIFECIGETERFMDVRIQFWKVDQSDKVYYTEFDWYTGEDWDTWDQDQPAFFNAHPAHHPGPSESFKAACKQKRDEMYPALEY